MTQEEFETLVDNLILEAWQFVTPFESSDYRDLVVGEKKRAAARIAELEAELEAIRWSVE